jgi:ABC-2 type transport system permease protein
MSWQAIARKDFEDAVRSRWVLGLSVLFVLLVAAAAYITRPAGGGTASSNAVLNSLVVRDALVTTLVPLIALVSAYGSVVGERSSGSLKLLLALPHSRADVVFGKVLGRAGAIAVPIAVGFLLPAVALLVAPGIQFEAASYFGFTLLVALLGVVFVAIAVGFSAAMSSTRLAVAGAVGVYFLFVPLWGAVRFPIQLYFGLSGGPSWLPVSGQQFVQFLTLLNPTGSFKTISGAFLNGSLFTGGEARIHVAAAAMLLAWLLVPPLLGLLRFESEDL